MRHRQLFVILSVSLLASCKLQQPLTETHRYKLTGIERSRILVDSRYDLHPDENAARFILPYRHQVDSVMGPVLGKVARNMSSNRPESDLSNLLSDILIWAAARYDEKPVLAVYNMGGIRADLTRGEVTYGDVLNIAPFENKIAFTTLSGETLLKLFRQIAKRGGEGVNHGCRLVISKDGKLISSTLNGQEIDSGASYRVVTIDYLLGGNDGMSAMNEGTDVKSPQEKQNNMRFIIMDYFRQKTARGEVVDAKVEGRITVR